MNSNQLGIAVGLLTSLLGLADFAEDGVSGKTILFGQVAAFTGPAQDLGQGMRQGILAAFDEANRSGGIAGRTLELMARDDGYEPEKTVVAKQLLDDDKVFAMSGAVGTPTSKASQPLATDAKVPFIGPFTGAEFLRNPFNRYVIVQRALAKRKMSLVASGSFKRNTTAVKTALLDIMKGNPEAVVTVGPYKPVAEFIKLAHQIKINPVFVAISFVGSNSLAQELGKDGAGVIISQVVPFPWDISLPVVASYQKALIADDTNAKPGFVSLEGYLAGRLAVEALKRVDGEPTREKLLDAIYSAPFDLGGFTLAYGPEQIRAPIKSSSQSFRPTTRSSQSRA